MTSRDFAYWLQGFFEINGTVESLNAHQLKVIQNHLNLVFQHEIDPSYSDNPAVLDALQKTHDEGITSKIELSPRIKIRRGTGSNNDFDSTTLIKC